MRFALLLCLALLGFGGAANAAVVFMYHRFGEDAFPSTSVRLEQFDAHLRHLDEAGYRVWPLERIAAALAAGQPIPDRVVALSVDDAYLSVYRQAWPRLRERGWPLTVFVSTDEVDRNSRGYMSWQQMREMAAEGARFANHGSGHDKLHRRRPGERDAAWAERIRAELAHAEARLREELGEAVPDAPKLLAYPYGEYDEALMRLVAGMGYVAFGQHSGALGAGSHLQSLPRYPMAEAYAEPREFAEKAATLPLPLLDQRPIDPVVGADNPPRLELRLGELDVDPRRLTCYGSGQGRLPVRWLAADRLEVRAAQAYPPGRARYNCTLPSRQAGRYYWFSQPWVVPGGED